jgi:hypothetical protein
MQNKLFQDKARAKEAMMAEKNLIAEHQRREEAKRNEILKREK